MLRQILSLSVVLSLFPITGCERDQDETEPLSFSGSSDDPVAAVAADDPEMQAAEKKARESVDDFIAALQDPQPGQSHFAVKARFEDGDQVEFMWVTDLKYADGTFTGVINNDPQFVGNVKIGDRHSVVAGEINDWMYMENEKIVGGHTIAVLLKRQRQSD
jgi:uncharacterized protein YegJ (DUF2314 family)